MKVLVLVMVSVLLFGFVLPDQSCSRVPSVMDKPAGKPDGPYVLYKNDQVFAKYIRENNGAVSVQSDSVPLSQKSGLVLTVRTDDPSKTFTVKLKNRIENEPVEFNDPGKLFIVSDIEGNFAAFRTLLQTNGVIDGDFNWIFGTGHLVLTGDFVDRGDQVTEVLWLIYSLEDKARAAGGYVHFVLGNHEIMNMSGDLRYLNKKYIDNARLLEEAFVSLYGENAELGRWLRSKNVAEKVGDILFIHGGISAEVNRMNVSAPEINQLVRPFYHDSTYKYPDPRIDTLYSNFGPFWYRGYYGGPVKAGATQIDSTLAKFGVKHIATGHTIIADTVSMLHDGKLFNTDVSHSKGVSEALLVEAGNFYRVNGVGERFPLLKK